MRRTERQKVQRPLRRPSISEKDSCQPANEKIFLIGHPNIQKLPRNIFFRAGNIRAAVAAFVHLWTFSTGVSTVDARNPYRTGIFEFGHVYTFYIDSNSKSFSLFYFSLTWTR